MKKAIISFLFLALGIAAASAQCSTPVKSYFLATSDWGSDTVFVTTCGDLVSVEAELEKVATTAGLENVISLSVPASIQRPKPVNGPANVFNPTTKALTNSGAQIAGGVLAFPGNAAVGDVIYVNLTYFR